MKKITLILAMMMVVLSAFAAQDGPKYRFMKGNSSTQSRFDKDIDHNGAFDVKYNSNSAGTSAINFDAINNSQTPKSIFRFGMGERGSNSSSIGGGSVSASRGVSLGGSHTATTSGSALSGALYGGKKGNDITLGQNGHLALFGNDLPIMDGEPTEGEGGQNTNAEGETPRYFPIGDAMLPLLMMIMAFAGFVYFRKK